MTADRAATVYASTWVPSPSPIEGFGHEGYAVCWVDVEDGERLQVLALGPAPDPETAGHLVVRVVGDVEVELFEAAS